jgi:riboflavin kinase/FMN adenylyltransferase
VIGYDHQFGKNREGSLNFLLEVCDTYGFEVIEIGAQEIDQVNVSSTKIRNAIKRGNMALAERYLGEPFELYGKIIQGQAIGREIGFPTANLDVESNVKLIPATGVYAVNMLLESGKILEGMMNIGNRPTISNGTNVSIEVHLFNFNGNLYNQQVTVQLLSRFRDEVKFDSVPELTEQLKKDEESICNYFINRQ